MYVLVDTFNGRTISRHRTFAAALAADDKLQRVLARNSSGAYLPTVVAMEDKDGSGVCIGPNRYYGVGRLATVDVTEVPYRGKV